MNLVSHKVFFAIIFFYYIFILINNIILYFKTLYIIASIIYKLSCHIMYWSWYSQIVKYSIMLTVVFMYIIMTISNYQQVFITDYLLIIYYIRVTVDHFHIHMVL